MDDIAPTCVKLVLRQGEVNFWCGAFEGVEPECPGRADAS